MRFVSPKEFPPETVFGLLKRAWAPLWNAELEQAIRQFDLEMTRYPDTAGSCAFVTCLDSELAGMGSYDPRPAPERALVGWNCVVPEHQGKGIGKAQIQEILRLFRARGVRKACVTTGKEDFFVPARRMYEACGFTPIRNTEDNTIEYELGLECSDS